MLLPFATKVAQFHKKKEMDINLAASKIKRSLLCSR